MIKEISRRGLWLIMIWLTTLPKIHISSSHELDADTVNRQLLQTIKSYMDFTKDSCTDFYQYACGNWETIHWDGQKYVDTIGRLEYDTNEEYAQLLEAIMGSDKERRNTIYRKLQAHYTACKGSGDHDIERYLELLHPTGNETTWPYHSTQRGTAWQGRGFNWMETLGKLRAYGLDNVLIQEHLNNINGKQFIVELNKPEEVALTEEEETYVLAFKNSSYMSERIQATRLQQLVRKLKKLHRDFFDTKAAQLLTLKQLTQKVPLLDMRAYLAQVLELPVANDMLVLVSNVAYLRQLVELLATTSKETIAHYIMLKLRTHISLQLPGGNTAQHCMQHLRQHMTLALDRMYEREHYTPHLSKHSDAVIQRVFSRMQSKFLEIIQQHANELSLEELDFLRQKIQLMRLNIGNLPSGVQDDYYDLYYADLELQHDNFVTNFLSIMRHSQLRQHQLLNVRHWDAPEFSYLNWRYASPAYVLSLNLLIIPFAYLRQPIFHPHYHELFLYAELGNTLGHELMHAFDINGLQLDAWGNPSRVFADAMLRPKFQSALRCLGREFTTSINEKIADFSGFHLAYEAYFQQAHQPHFHQELVLSNKQLFYIKFAQFFCAVSPNRIYYDESHDTPFKRVPQVVENQEDFDKVFNCGVKARMKCNLW